VTEKEENKIKQLGYTSTCKNVVVKEVHVR